MKNATQFGKLIRKARLRMGVRQTDVAGAAKISQAFLCQLETGNHRYGTPGAEAVVRIATYLGIDPLRALRIARPDFAVWKRAFAGKTSVAGGVE